MGRLRAAKSKVRTGCRTCKQRRVKCDEAKPDCNRCTKSGRPCGGYEIVASKTVVHGSAPKYILPGRPPGAGGSTLTYLNSMPTAIPGANADENNYFGFFVRYTAPTIGGAFPSAFFERFVLQLSLREPMIRHAATALGALQRAQERYGKITLDNEEAGFALQQYGKAINLTRKKLFAPDLASQRLKLVACILFICYEVAQKHFRETAMHLENGMYLLVHVRHKGTLPDGWDTEDHGNADDAAALDREILKTFDRLDIQSTYIRSTKPKFPANPIAIARRTPRRFANLEQARTFLAILKRSIVLFRHDVRATPSPFTAEDEKILKTRQMEIRHQMQAWNSAFGTLKLPHVPLLPNQPPPTDVAARAVLEAASLTENIFLETAVADGKECVFDAFTNDFRTILELGQLAIDHPRCPNSSPLTNGGASFRIHMGCIPSVYAVALKCREPTIRRKAVKLLESFPFREGMWDAGLGAALCRHVMEVEEAGYSNLTSAQDLPEKARVHEAMFDITDWKDGIPVFYKRRDFDGEYGRAGSWLNWSGRSQIAKEALSDSESVWKCSEQYHYFRSGTGRCLGCGKLAEEVPMPTRDDRVGSDWSDSSPQLQHHAHHDPHAQMAHDGHGVGEASGGYASSSNDSQSEYLDHRSFSPQSLPPGPPGRAPTELVPPQRSPRAQSCTADFFHYDDTISEYYDGGPESSGFSDVCTFYHPNSLPHSPPPDEVTAAAAAATIMC